jgi:hypothetical protein
MTVLPRTGGVEWPEVYALFPGLGLQDVLTSLK